LQQFATDRMRNMYANRRNEPSSTLLSEIRLRCNIDLIEHVVTEALSFEAILFALSLLSQVKTNVRLGRHDQADQDTCNYFSSIA
jgi:hypothetical protein